MLLYADHNTYKQRAAEFDARRADVRSLRKTALDMDALAKGNGAPSPSDVMLLHDRVVSPDLRARIVDACKRMWMMSPDDRLAYREAISPLADAIQDLIDRHGFKYTPLMRLISPRSMPSNPLSLRIIENHQIGAKLAKFDGNAQRSSDLNHLIDPRLPPRLRQRLIAEKNRIDDAVPAERSAVRKSAAVRSLLAEVDALEGVVGAEAVAALRRLLS